MRQGQPEARLDRHALGALRKVAGARRQIWDNSGLSRITLHEARHTYASFLMAAGYNLKQIQEYLGHADLAPPPATSRTFRSPAERPSGRSSRRTWRGDRRDEP